VIVVTSLLAVCVAGAVLHTPEQSKERPASGKWHATKWGRSYLPSKGYLPDQKSAIQVTKAILAPIYGDEAVNDEEPFYASLEGNIWTVKGAVRPYPFGNAEVKLSKTDGAILFVTHSQ
jgi:NTF2 fold immunity protein